MLIHKKCKLFYCTSDLESRRRVLHVTAKGFPTFIAKLGKLNRIVASERLESAAEHFIHMSVRVVNLSKRCFNQIEKQTCDKCL